MRVWSNEGVLVQDAPQCILCGREGSLLYSRLRDRLFSAPGRWSLMRCRGCDLVWLNPRPLPEEIGKLYEDYHTHVVPSGNVNRKRLGRIRTLVKNSILRSSYGYRIEGARSFLGWLLSRLGPLREMVGGSVLWLHFREKGRLLDIGCGNGQFLARMRDLGWEVMGIEPDPEAVRIAREHFGLEVIQGTVEEVKLPEQSFDVITMNHVVEHLLEPVVVLTKLRRLLKPGGKFIIVTPNAASLGRRFFKRNWLHWDPPRHIFIFSPRSLQSCAERAGLRVRRLWTSSKSARRMWMMSGVIARYGYLPGDLLQKGTSLGVGALFFWGLEYILNYVWPVGEELVLEAGI